MSGAPGVYQGGANVIAALMLLLEFGMLRQALVRDQVRLYAAQSALISVLAVVIAADRNLPDLYALAALSALLKVVAVPLVLRRLLGSSARRGDAPGVAGSYTLNPASAVLACIVLAAFGFFCFGSLGIHSAEAPVLALSIAGAMVFVAFGLMIVRRDVASQAIGFFSLENAVSLASLVLAAELPLLLETAFLFDLLLAVVVFGDADPGASRAGRVAVDRRPQPAARIGDDDARKSSWPSSPSRWPSAIMSFFVPARVAAGLTIASGIASFALALALVPDAARHEAPTYLSYLRADAVSCVFLLATAFLYAAVAVYAAGDLKGRTGRTRAGSTSASTCSPGRCSPRR